MATETVRQKRLTVYVPDELYEQFRAAVNAERRTLTAVTVRLLEAYVASAKAAA